MRTSTDEPTTRIASEQNVQEVVRSAEQQLADLLRRKAEIVRRIGTVKQLLAGLANLFGESILDEELLRLLDRGTSNRRRGFTQACRQVLMSARAPLRGRDGCEELLRQFPELVRHHKDLPASVTTVFHRLVDYGEARCFVDARGARVWEWAADRGASVPDLIADSRDSLPQESSEEPRYS